jgi:hypothetical protein
MEFILPEYVIFQEVHLISIHTSIFDIVVSWNVRTV